MAYSQRFQHFINLSFLNCEGGWLGSACLLFCLPGHEYFCMRSELQASLLLRCRHYTFEKGEGIKYAVSGFCGHSLFFYFFFYFTLSLQMGLSSELYYPPIAGDGMQGCLLMSVFENKWKALTDETLLLHTAYLQAVDTITHTSLLTHVLRGSNA